MNFSCLSPAARAIWAKSGEPSGHSLLAHMLDVAAVAETLLLRESPETRRWALGCFGLPEDGGTRWLAMICGLHDFGKAIPGFQRKWAEGQRADETAGLPFPISAQQVSRHDFASSALLRRLLSTPGGAAGWVLSVTQALGAHHGYMPTPLEVKESLPFGEGSAWHGARTELLDAYLQTLGIACTAMEDDPSLPAVAWLAGLTSVADWIGSNPEWFPPGERDESLPNHFQAALGLAESALNAIGWPHFESLLAADQIDADALITHILGQSAGQVTARPLQAAADSLLGEGSGPALLIVEAPMGEGKTELAFLAHLRLQAANGHRGLYVALPTQATGTAMFGRALRFLHAFGAEQRLDIQLVQAGAQLDERVHRLRGIDASSAESVSSSIWFSQRRRPLLSPYGVGTIDQALFATLNVKHHFVRLWGLANRVVVLDEVHAYDTYTGGLIEALLRWLKALNCSVVLMSATLPARKRADLLRAWDAAEPEEIPYPRLLVARGGGTSGAHVPCRPLAPIEVSGLAEDLAGIANAAAERLSSGGCGAVILNTVQRAQELYRLLRGRLCQDTQLVLLHARFPGDERSSLEQRVLAMFGHGERAQRPDRALLVATQVAEQSLDIDFDFMLSDLAPIDLLLQRTGRLHRHKRGRPAAHAKPRLAIAGLLKDRPPELQDTAWGYVYDPYILYCTWRVAGTETTWQLPEDIDRLVQAVYSGDPFAEGDRDELAKTMDRALGEHFARTQHERQLAANVAIDARDEPQVAYQDKPRADEEGTGHGIAVVTRLGQDSVTVVPVHVTRGGWRLRPGDPPFAPDLVPDDELARRIYARQLRLSRKQVVLGLAGEPAVAAFEEHPLLRHFKPLPLADGAAQFGNLRVRLDPDLGIVYETLTSTEIP